MTRFPLHRRARFNLHTTRSRPTVYRFTCFMFYAAVLSEFMYPLSTSSSLSENAVPDNLGVFPEMCYTVYYRDQLKKLDNASPDAKLYYVEYFL